MINSIDLSLNILNAMVAKARVRARGNCILSQKIAPFQNDLFSLCVAFNHAKMPKIFLYLLNCRWFFNKQPFSVLLIFVCSSTNWTFFSFLFTQITSFLSSCAKALRMKRKESKKKYFDFFRLSSSLPLASSSVRQNTLLTYLTVWCSCFKRMISHRFFFILHLAHVHLILALFIWNRFISSHSLCIGFFNLSFAWI